MVRLLSSVAWVAGTFVALAGAQSQQPTPGGGALSPATSSQPNFIQTPPCPGFTPILHSYAGGGGAIPDATTVQFQINVVGIEPSLWDLDLTTAITHTACYDLDVTLTSPAGTVVVVTTDNGFVNDDVFNGTLWDESAIMPVGDYLWVNGQVATPLIPEGSFTDFRGENPNGTWTLTITDDLANNSGNLASWKLDLFSLASNPPSYGVTFSHVVNQPIVDNLSVVDAIDVAGLGTSIAKIEVYTEILHAASYDLDITLYSPTGVAIVISTDNGLSNDNNYNGTWFDEAAPTSVSDAIYANNVVLPWLEPEGSFDACTGDDPNGQWRLDVLDDANVNTGTFVSWKIKITTCGACTGSLTNYCTAGTSTNGCAPTMAWVGSPSATQSSGFVVHANGVEGLRSGIFFYGINGRVALPWGSTGSTSFMCVKQPVQRTAIQNSGGSLSTCTGHYSLDLNAYWAANPLALGQPLTQGETFQVQAWYRDPPAPKGTHLTDAIEFSLCP